MFAPRTNQLGVLTAPIEGNMSTSLQVKESSPFFADNMMIAQGAECCYPDANTFHGGGSDCDFSRGIYNLRPRGAVPHITTINPPLEIPEKVPPPAKPKRPRNSLKKRLLVNARERDRMRVLNNGFQALRDALPCYIADGHMAKITTLRLAINYIKALTEVLNEEAPSCTPISRCDSAQPSCVPPGTCTSNMMSTVTCNESGFQTDVLPSCHI